MACDRLHTLAHCAAGSRPMTATLCAYRKCANTLGQRCDVFGCTASRAARGFGISGDATHSIARRPTRPPLPATSHTLHPCVGDCSPVRCRSGNRSAGIIRGVSAVGGTLT
ncbi:hypothetical protein XCV0361 [Xanthomonas euvesicatoria pv. vesicatoria str. 85-10]|uniref:Uncharacterized protein n=1 Tax=Xanthomonas euvesicatoria pv. vesicatoria (strain 85-10) TaxID=316273 RepID=Q3BYS1_XANE5|nr:hypothetical protein XCV0361 [Xanthomonas euvesicatoria pv. vesicatoria str. 85-10]